MTDLFPAFASIKTLAAAYLAAAAATLAFVALERDDAGIVDADVWTHAIMAFGFALLLVDFANRAAQGSRRAYLRLRISSVVIAAFSGILVVTPGLLPTWMKVEQGMCALVLAAVALLAHSPAANAFYGDEARAPEEDAARGRRRTCAPPRSSSRLMR
jgi:hypothetical protein